MLFLDAHAVAAWNKLIYISNPGSKLSMSILEQILTMVHNDLRMSFNSCMILIKWQAFNFIFDSLIFILWFLGLLIIWNTVFSTSLNNQGSTELPHTFSTTLYIHN